MDAPLYCEILTKTLLPFIAEKFPPPDSHRFCKIMIPKSRAAQDFFSSHNVNWWRTPPESPDMNPIENLWHEMKEFIRCQVKPKNKQELINGIINFWDLVDVHKCYRYINHLKKVLPKVIEVYGDPTGY